MSIKRAVILAVGMAMLSGCTPRSLAEALFPTCKQQDLSCNMRERTSTGDLVDTTRWSKLLPTMRPLSDSMPIPKPPQ
jgi:hypothetical protein